MKSIGFCDVSEGNEQKTQNEGKMVNLGEFFSPWPIRKLQGEATSLPGRAVLQPPPLILL